MKTTGRSYFESIRFIKSKEKETSIEDLVNKKLYKPKEFIKYDELLIKRLNNQALESPRAIRYFEGRRITRQSIEKFSLGFSEKQDMVTIPVQSPDGMTIGFVARTIEGKEFKNTPGLPKSKILFNLHRVKQSKRVYVVESSFDAIRLDQVGLPAVATLGANVSSSQIELLQKYFNNIIPMRSVNYHEFITYAEQDNMFYHYPINMNDVKKMSDKKKNLYRTKKEKHKKNC